jgi:hypothetical protein
VDAAQQAIRIVDHDGSTALMSFFAADAFS